MAKQAKYSVYSMNNGSINFWKVIAIWLMYVLLIWEILVDRGRK